MTTGISLLKKLSSYSLVSSAFFAIGKEADAQYVFSDVNPDIVIDANNPSVVLDLNGDLVNDFRFSQDANNPDEFLVEGYDNAPRLTFGCFFYYVGAAYNYYATVYGSAPSTYWGYNTLGIFGKNTLACGDGNLKAADFSADMKFLPVALEVGNDQHYGWFRLRVDNVLNTLTIKEYAYNSAPDQTDYLTGVAGSFVDELENNNTFATAKAISANTDIEGSIRASDDVDWFTFTISASQNNMKLELTNLPANYNLSLYNASKQKLGQSNNNGVTSEEIILNGAAAGTYYAKVQPKGAVFDFNNPYTIRVNTSSTPFRISQGGMPAVEFWIAPNPAASVVKITLVEPAENVIQLSLKDISGRAILEKKLPAGSIELDLSVADFSEGIYLLELNSGWQTEIRKIEVVH